MDNQDIQEVLETIDQEGFDYCFLNKTRFENIKDEEFHKLRLAYIKAHNNLEKFLEN
jgi:hypothetical protein